jgi:hypothetical protein
MHLPMHIEDETGDEISPDDELYEMVAAID